jgi:hypothetical protein
MKSLRLSHALASLALGATLVVATSPVVRANDDHGRSRCQRSTERAQQKYQEEVREHGRRSPQAQNARARLNETWDRCYSETHAWYDPHRQQWRTDRDWDRNYDWDRDGDRDHDGDHDRR